MNETTRNCMVGLTVLVALVCLGIMIASFAGIPSLLQTGQSITIHVPKSAGVRVGDPVHIADIRVGAITSVGLADRSNPGAGVRITARIDDDVVLPEDSVMVFSSGWMGSAFINIQSRPDIIAEFSGDGMPGIIEQSSPTDAFAPAMETLEGVGNNINDLTGRLIVVSEDLSHLLRSLTVTAERLERGEGTLGQLSANPALYNEMTAATRQLAELLTQLTVLAQQWQEQGIEVTLE
jgi:ABC-type transporter Mla subunit MlaD